MPKEVLSIAAELLTDPVRVAVAPAEVVVPKIEQKVFFVDAAAKRGLLTALLRDRALRRVLVFTRTKRGAKRLALQLDKAGVASEAIHGDRPQNGRMKTLAAFRAGSIRVLVATDVAARGIDVPEISHVVNFDIPHLPESYVHRIGRTGRAGSDGIAWSFCDPAEVASLRSIERLTGHRLPSELRGGAPAGAAPIRMAPPKRANRRRRTAGERRAA
jgi:ATP-dependent RNA helicase RhlE